MENVSVNVERLERLNQGFNFLNIEDKEKTQYYIDVFLEVKQNLKEKTETIKAKTNLPFVSSYNYWKGTEVIAFLNELDMFSKKPLFVIKKWNNRKNTKGYDRDLSSLKGKFRKNTLIFSDIKINIKELAEEKLKEIKLDFKTEVKKFLKQQKKTDKEKQKLLDRFIYLKEKELTLKTFLEKQSSYSYGKPKDRTIKILITPQEYNQQLKDIEKEMKQVAKEFKLELDDFNYLVIEQKVDFDKWLEVNKDKIKENYDYYEDEAEETFDEYCKRLYDESGGIIEVQDEI